MSGIKSKISEGRSSGTVLFVDDEPSIRLTLPPILAEQGFTVSVASSVASALEEISSHSFDVVLSDLNINKPRDGFLVVHAARAANPLCVAILLTGYPDFDSAAEGFSKDVDGYLVKPAEIENLLKLIDQKLALKIPPQQAQHKMLNVG
jgi:DNA-binding NtrC family response regulator